ncbi:hypothetical protein PoB_001598100 [Plakobranchus ocellatus]|uniref:Uncharacterized protein n=1 Tax=Plakobranchus ocellatus TaxID=259542 RepID=A0AAV3Z0X0_9GAST|nr:hypothetical protein PoB_001598100 [Plakobranchus ocellatus]
MRSPYCSEFEFKHRDHQHSDRQEAIVDSMWKIPVWTASMAVLLVTRPGIDDPPRRTCGPKKASNHRGGAEPWFKPKTLESSTRQF